MFKGGRIDSRDDDLPCCLKVAFRILRGKAKKDRKHAAGAGGRAEGFGGLGIGISIS
jgi:hypothetical protein